MKKLLVPLIALVAVVAVDQATKLWVISALSEQPPVQVLGNFFMLTLVYNEGGAMGSNFGSPAYYLVSSSLILLFILFYIYSHRNSRTLTIPLALIAGGAMGNIVDRIRFGRVVDFLDVDFFDIDLFGFHIERWWTFNVADAMISCSIVFLLVRIIFFQQTPSSRPPRPESATNIAPPAG